METFNYLLGLRVVHTDTFDFSRKEDSRKNAQKSQKESDAKLLSEENPSSPFASSASFCGNNSSPSAPSEFSAVKKIQVVVGLNPAGEKVLVLWRNALAVDNADLDAFFQKQGYNTKDMEFALIYVNGDNNLENLKRPDDTWKVRRTEDEFKRLMFDVADI